MTANWFAFEGEGLLRFCESNEFDWDHSSLVEQLEETMLAIGAWFSEINNCSLVVDFFSFSVDSLSVAFHVQLLNVWSKLA